MWHPPRVLQVISGAGGALPSSACFSPLTDAYGTKGTAPLGAADTGQSWWTAQNAALAALSVISGKVTNTTTAPGVRGGHRAAGGGGGIPTMGGSVARAGRSVPNVTDTGFHLIVSDISWSLAVWQNQIETAIGGATFGTPLATDGTTVHTVSATISSDTATIHLPDGSTGVVTDARIASLAGWYAGFEVYQGNASTDTKAAFTTVNAST